MLLLSRNDGRYIKYRRDLKDLRSEKVSRRDLTPFSFSAHEMAERTGCVAVVVDAKPDAVTFYERYGFEPFELLTGALGDRPFPLLMVLPLGSIPKPV